MRILVVALVKFSLSN